MLRLSPTRPARVNLLLIGICVVTLALVFYTTQFVLQKPDLDPKNNGVVNRILRSTTQGSGESTGPCQLPRLDPFDPSVLKYVNRSTLTLEIDCSKKYGRPILFTTDYGSNLIRLEEPDKYGLRDCHYKPFERKNEEEVTISSTSYPIKNKTTQISPEHEFIIVYCSNSSDRGISFFDSWIRIPWTTNTHVIDMFHFVHEESVPPADDLEVKPPQDSLNVVMIGIDSVSHMNLIRLMPRTYSYLQNTSAIGMNGYTKVGSNSFPNLVPLLTGLTEKEVEVKDGCWAGGYFDSCPLIWKNFSQVGYVTSYADDTRTTTTFNYEKDGFQLPPTDFYLHPFLSTIEDHLGHGAGNQCIGPRLGLQVELELLKKLAVTMGRPSVDRKYFVFMWSSTLTHSVFSNTHHADQPVLNLLQWFDAFEARKIQPDSLLILLSDHGMRFGEVRGTVQGRIEDNMPLIYFLFPEWFKVKYSVAIHNLKTNSERLITAFDIHETLLDLIDPAKYISNEILPSHRHNRLDSDRVEHFDGRKQKHGHQFLPRGISLFAPVPPSRTCADAAIDPHFCVCQAVQIIPSPGNDARVRSATKFVLSRLNGLLTDSPECAQLRLAEIHAAQQQQLVYNDVGIGMAKKFKLTVTFGVKPSGAIFEATVVQDQHQDEKQGQGDWVNWVLAGDVSRVNLYGNQSHCVHDYKLKNYCFCSK